MDWQKKIVCPLCGSKNTKVILRNWKQAIKGILFLYEEKSIKIRACRTCTNAWTDPHPQFVDYQNADFHAAIKHTETKSLVTLDTLPVQWRKSILMQANLLAQYLPLKAKILEIGCGEGILLNELSKLGFNVKGIEPSETGSQRARKKGLDCITGYFPNSAIQESFDAVIMSHVLEHLQNPTQILKEVASAAPQGYLLLVQTNYQGLLPQWLRWGWYAWVFQEHYWHFTPTGLAQITSNLGFKPVDCEFSALVHKENFSSRFTDRVATISPSLHDQFHILFKI